MIGQELRELLAACDAAVEQIDAAEGSAAAIRTAARDVSDLVALTARLQKEGADVEFEDVPAQVRAHVDGRLLQRVGFVASRAQQTALLLRQLGQGIRDLRADCADLRAIATKASEPAS